MLGFCLTSIVFPVHTEESGKLCVRPFRQQPEVPAKERRRDAKRSDRMTHIVLTVAKGALAVLPCLPPLNRSQRNKKARAPLKKRLPLPVREKGALLDRVLARHIVKDAPIVE
jgi:hypothetical protein